ncbi:response regulator transcription factor [Adlercreutzia faecimuris]|uniref:Helix-turn-helix transcriptional regulator n=1 Tax=Adlercreutzia faecimuris TaxID=2897341 RepID=A0ABS9WJW4_9ACTN|nr:helix-turn-helix transcriptional regulator [Adlercreutzia sp. JBNU-10]MCI2242880.1 helix-turn-helix transcriptional regulator [Adlercreutzia sp. JBNU-10]
MPQIANRIYRAATGVPKDEGERPADDVTAGGMFSPTRLGMDIGRQWPSLKLVGFGIYYAWIWISYNSSVLMVGDAPEAQVADTVFATYLASTLALAAMLLGLSCAVRSVRRLVESKGVMLVFALLASLGTVGVWVSSVHGVQDNLALSAAGALTGVGTSFIVLRFGLVYAKVPPREVVMYSTASFVFACMIYFLAVGLPEPLGLAFTACLPVAAALTTMTDAELVEGDDPRPAVLPRPKSGVGRFFGRLVAAVVIFSLVVGVARGFSILNDPASTLDDQGVLIVFGSAVFAGAVFLIVGLLGRSFDISCLYYPAIILLAAGILVTPLLDHGSAFNNYFVGIAYNCFVLVIWCLLAYVAYRSTLPALRVFGLGRGASALGTTVGWFLGSRLLELPAESSFSLNVVSVSMVFALLVVSMLVLNDRVIGEALRTPDEHGPVRADAAAGARDDARCAGGDASEGERAADAGCDREAPCEAAAPADWASDGAPEQEVPGSAPGSAEIAWQLHAARCDALAARYALSPRERDVLYLLARGRSIDYIAQDLSISFNTAKSHIRHIYVKADIHSRQELLDLMDAEPVR